MAEIVKDRASTPGSPFSADYATARDRFRRAAEALGFGLESLPIDRFGPRGETLAIDVALLGSTQPERVLLVSTGLHGVEGFFGSAVQLALLNEKLRGWKLGPGDALLLLHGLNPFGFAWIRRFDEENVDLNRNFLLAGQTYSGSPDGYAALDQFLNPPSPPGWLDLYYPRAILAVLRIGTPALKSSIAHGQYDYPRGLFFGGHGPSQVQRILAASLPRWLSTARSVLHLDFHTGLGPWSTYKLLVEPEVKPERIDWMRDQFGAEKLELVGPNGISYPTRGEIGTWCRALFPDRRYDQLCAEFGTYAGMRVLAALRAENQAHQWLDPDHPAYLRAKRRLLEAFVPADGTWRASTISQAVELLGHCFNVAFRR
jgi:hypothetical protein